MNQILPFLSSVSAGVAGALFAAIWEGAVLAIAVALCLRMFPRLSSAARSVVWLNVFVLLVLLHFVPAFAPPAAGVASRPVSAVHLDLRWSLAIAGLWLVLSVWRGVQFVLGLAHLARLARRAVPVPVDAAVRALLADAPGRRPTELCAAVQVRRPSVLGFFRPRILLPPGLAEALTPQELHQVVLHEMEHLRRGDDWTNLLQKIGLVLFPLNPVLLWVERRLCAERELACDDRVIHSNAGRKAYALCLARLAEFSLFRRSFSLVLGLWEHRPELIRRVQRIVSQPVHSMGRRTAMAATGGILAGALGCAVALAHSPQLVSFIPAHPAVVVAAPLDPHVVARVLGGTVQLTGAVMPAPGAETHPSRAKTHAGVRLVSARFGSAPGRLKTCPFKSVDDSLRQSAGHPRAAERQVVLKTVSGQRAEGSRIAELNPPPAQLPALDERQLIVLTEVTMFQTPPRVVLAVSGDHRTVRTVAVPATYAIVPVPNGWLIIQI